MTILQVIDMTCNHCVKTITSSVLAVAPSATVVCDVSSKSVTVLGLHDSSKVEIAIKEAGYTPTHRAPA